MKAKSSIFLLLGLCLAIAPHIRCNEPDDFDVDDGVVVEDDSVSCKYLFDDKSCWVITRVPLFRSRLSPRKKKSRRFNIKVHSRILRCSTSPSTSTVKSDSRRSGSNRKQRKTTSPRKSPNTTASGQSSRLTGVYSRTIWAWSSSRKLSMQQSHRVSPSRSPSPESPWSFSTK